MENRVVRSKCVHFDPLGFYFFVNVKLHAISKHNMKDKNGFSVGTDECGYAKSANGRDCTNRCEEFHPM